MPRFTLVIDQHDAAFFGGLSLAVAGAALVAWPLVLMVVGAAAAAIGYKGAVDGPAIAAVRRAG
jgi:hypothetical protein